MIPLMAFAATLILGGLLQVDAQIECPGGSFYDKAEKSCQGKDNIYGDSRYIVCAP